MAEVMATLRDIIAVIEGLGAAGELFGMLTSALAALGTFGPAGLIVHIVWGIYTGDLDWDKIKEAVIKVTRAIQAAGRLLRKHFPDWWNTVVDSFSGETPGLLEALYGADDRMREAVYRGDHKYAPYKMHVQMIRTMKDGWISTADAICIAMVSRRQPSGARSVKWWTSWEAAMSSWMAGSASSMTVPSGPCLTATASTTSDPRRLGALWRPA